jgi:hypothetical protein
MLRKARTFGNEKGRNAQFRRTENVDEEMA